MEHKEIWVSISHIDMPRKNWIWWLIDGPLASPGAKTRSFHSLSALQEELEKRGYTTPSSTQVNEVVLQARVDGKDEAVIQVAPPPSAT